MNSFIKLEQNILEEINRIVCLTNSEYHIFRMKHGIGTSQHSFRSIATELEGNKNTVVNRYYKIIRSLRRPRLYKHMSKELIDLVKVSFRQ
jgi:hypothetical protein